jgi:hypothetical protein
MKLRKEKIHENIMTKRLSKYSKNCNYNNIAIEDSELNINPIMLSVYKDAVK